MLGVARHSVFEQMTGRLESKIKRGPPRKEGGSIPSRGNRIYRKGLEVCIP